MQCIQTDSKFNMQSPTQQCNTCSRKTKMFYLQCIVSSFQNAMNQFHFSTFVHFKITASALIILNRQHLRSMSQQVRERTHAWRKENEGTFTSVCRKEASAVLLHKTHHAFFQLPYCLLHVFLYLSLVIRFLTSSLACNVNFVNMVGPLFPFIFQNAQSRISTVQPLHGLSHSGISSNNGTTMKW